ncbi:MAG: YfcC family protein [Tissierellia bacterium]|nr:YfcC family protein [Tissierellia bacterium]
MSENNKANQTKKKRQINFNPFMILFIIIILIYSVSFFVTPGEFDREVIDGRSQVIPGSYHEVERGNLSPFDIFRAIPYGFEGSASIMFLILIVGGVIEVYNKTGAIPVAVTRLVNFAGDKGGAIVIAIIYSIFAVLGGFLGWLETVIPFVPLVIPVILALGYDIMTATAVVTLGTMVGFAVGPTNMYTVGISHQIAELPMFSGFGLRLAAYLVFCIVALVYILIYAEKVKKDPSKSIVKEINVDDLRVSYDGEEGSMTWKHAVSLLALVGAFVASVYGMMKLGWGINDLTATFFAAGLLTAIIGSLGVEGTVKTFTQGAAGAMGGAMVIGVARGIQWMLTRTGLMDPIVNSLSQMLQGLSPFGTTVGVFFLITIMNGIVASGSGKAVALMPIIIPLADILGISRQTATLAYQFGDGVSNMIWFTYGGLLIFLAYGKIPLGKWYKFFLPLFFILMILSIIFLFIAVQIGY